MGIFILRSLGLTCPCLSCHEMSSFSPVSVVLCSHSVLLGVGDEGRIYVTKIREK